MLWTLKDHEISKVFGLIHGHGMLKIIPCLSFGPQHFLLLKNLNKMRMELFQDYLMIIAGNYNNFVKQALAME